MDDAARQELTRLMEEAGPAVQRVLRKCFGVSLSAGDGRAENQRALECADRVQLELVEKLNRVLTGEDPPVANFSSYAATVARHAWADEIRGEHRDRACLKNRLRRFLAKHPGYGIWADDRGTLLAGYAGWQSLDASRPSERLAALRQDPGLIAPAALPQVHWEKMGASEWDALLTGVFDYLEGPLDLDGLVELVVGLCGIGPAWKESLDEERETAADYNPHLADRKPTPEQAAVLAEQLRILWQCIRGLRREWRLPFLLNPPSLRKDLRGELDILVIRGVTSVAEIHDVLDLSADDYQILSSGLEMEPGVSPEDASASRLRFARLWNHLPIPDKLIGQLLGKSQLQVGALRRLANHQLAQCIGRRDREE